MVYGDIWQAMSESRQLRYASGAKRRKMKRLRGEIAAKDTASFWCRHMMRDNKG